MLHYNKRRRIARLLSIKLSEKFYILIYRDRNFYCINSHRRPHIYSCNSCVVTFYWQKSKERDSESHYAGKGGIVVACLVAIWRRNIVSSLSQMVGEFILISAATNLFDTKRNITSSNVNELSLIILRRSNLGVCNNSIFLGRVNSICAWH